MAYNITAEEYAEDRQIQATHDAWIGAMHDREIVVEAADKVEGSDMTNVLVTTRMGNQFKVPAHTTVWVERREEAADAEVSG